MAYDVLSVAEWIIGEAARQNFKVTPMQLQKILYYCQGEYLGMTGEPLFDEPVVAWEHGPVVKAVYYRYRSFGRNAITPCDAAAPAEVSDFIRYCVKEKAPVSASGLRGMTHREEPYRCTPLNSEILRELMRSFFEKKFYASDEEDVYEPDFEDEEEAVKSIAKNFTAEELDELIETK